MLRLISDQHPGKLASIFTHGFSRTRNCAMNDISSDIGLLRREVRDVRGIVANLDNRSRKAESAAIHPQQLLARTLTCHAIGRQRARPAAAVAAETYGNDPALLKALASPGLVGKAASGPAMTSDAAWAGTLAQAGTSDTGFLQMLTPNSIYAQLSKHPGAIRVSLAGRGSIKVPSRTPAPSLTTPFVGEGSAMPVRQLALSNASLAPKKCATGSQFSEEMFKHSVPTIESVIRATLAFDIAVAIDGVLLSNAAASIIAPAGLLAGVTATPATAGGGLNAFGGDVRALVAAIEATGPLSNPALIMSVSSGLMLGTQLLGTMAASSVLDMPVLTSPTVPAKRLILVDAANYASGEGDEPSIDTSREAAWHAEDTLPLPIVGGVAQPPPLSAIAAPVYSTFQNATVAIRLIQDCSWVMTRAGRVAYVDQVTW
jgi:hypothetical protein